MGAITNLITAAKEYGLLGLVIVAIAYVLGVSAKPFFKFLATDRENRRRHTRLMEKRRKPTQNKIEAKNRQKGKSDD
jgi:hypothetical protein